MRRTLKDADLEIIALKRELIEARTRALTLSGEVSRLEEGLDLEKQKLAALGAACDVFKATVNDAWKALGYPPTVDTLAQEITELKQALDAAPDQDDVDDAESRADEAEGVAEAMLEALEEAGVDWGRVWWKYGSLSVEGP